MNVKKTEKDGIVRAYPKTASRSRGLRRPA